MATSTLAYASGTEIFQFLVAMIGLALSMWGLWTAVVDAVELSDAPMEDLRRLIALGNMRNQLASLSVHGLLVYIGVVSMLLPPPSPLPEVVPELEQSVLIRLGLVAITIILVVDAILERRLRFIFMERAMKIKHTISPRGEAQDLSVTIGGQEVASGKISHTTIPVHIPVIVAQPGAANIPTGESKHDENAQ